MILYETNFEGGVTVAGYSPGAVEGPSTGTFSIHALPEGSTIRKAYLIAGRYGSAEDITVTLNGIEYIFENSNQESASFNSPIFGGASGVHAIDITADIDPEVTDYTLTIPIQKYTLQNRYNDFALYIAFDNASLPFINSVINLNEEDIASAITHTLIVAEPIGSLNFKVVGLSLMTGSIFDSRLDGTKVKVNGKYITPSGSLGIGGRNSNSGIGASPLGSFYMTSGQLTGLLENRATQAMVGVDVVSNIKSLIEDGSNELELVYETITPNNITNIVWAEFLTYSDS